MRETSVTYEFYPGAVEEAFTAAQTKLVELQFARRLAARDPSLFSADPARHPAIADRLGWVNSCTIMRRAVPALAAFVGETAAAELNQVVLLGMGGSSLCPEVLGKVFGLPAHLNTYIVLDSTAPSAVATAARAADPHHTLFVVASKSGATVETRSHAEFFFARQQDRTENPGAHFVAITDPGSALETWANQLRFRRVFLNPPDIGGRFSAISYFGLVPAALLGVDLTGLLETVAAAAKTEAVGGPGQMLGAFLHACAQKGRDKITFFPSALTAPLIPWIEQLLAESTGKEGKGIFPIEGEPTGTLAVYGADRAIVTTRLANEEENERSLVDEFRNAGLPVAEVVLPSRDSLGAAFLQWEWATAAIGCLLGVNPFDEPNVKESKDNTGRLLAEFEKHGRLARWPETARTETLVLRAKGIPLPASPDTAEVLASWCAGIHPGDYVAILAYLASDDALETEVAAIRRIIRDRLNVATLRGWGPRFLHSIGQLYKGGPARGHFLVLTQTPDDDLAIPGRPYTFGELITAQALGDADALASRSRPVLHVELTGDAQDAVRSLSALITDALARR